MSKRYCLNCGSLIPEEATHCPVCGEPVKNTVPTQNNHPGNPVNERRVADPTVAFPTLEDDGNEATQKINTAELEKTKVYQTHNNQPQLPVQDEDEPKKKRSLKNIVDSIMFEEVEEDEPEQKEKKHHPVLITFLIILAVLIGAFAYLYIRHPVGVRTYMNRITSVFTGNRDNNQTSTPTPTATVEADPTPSATATASVNPNIGKTATVLIDHINIRTQPSTNANQNGTVTKGSTYTIKDVTEAESYTWYQIGDNQWIADQGGQWVSVQ